VSKNKQKNLSEINLGNDTYHRGFNDGLNGRPKTIKKTHRHVHRYHIGYKAGQAEARTTMRAALAQDDNGVRSLAYQAEHLNLVIPKPVEDLQASFTKPTLWQRAKRWLFG